MLDKAQAISVFSIQDHNCLLNEVYRDYIKRGRQEQPAVFLANMSLVKHIHEEQPEAILMSFSIYQSTNAQALRQANNKDHNNLTGDFHSALAGLSSDTIFDDFILSKVFAKSFAQKHQQITQQEIDRATQQLTSAKNADEKKALRSAIAAAKAKIIPEFPEDHSLLLLVYAQMHHIAAKNPGKRIKYNLVHSNPELLKKIASFLQNPVFAKLKPHYLALHCLHYDGRNPPVEIAAIPAGIGGGAIDFNYIENTKKLFENYQNCFDVDVQARHNLINKVTEDQAAGEKFVKTFISKRQLNSVFAELSQYKKQREQSNEYYFFTGWLKGMSKTIKLTAVDKVLQSLEGKKVAYTAKDLAALADGTLSNIIEKHKDQAEIREILTEIEKIRLAAGREICAKFSLVRV